MKNFNNSTNISLDECAKFDKNIFDYQTFNFFKQNKDCGAIESEIGKLQAENPNIFYKIGYGQPDSCYTDISSKLSMGQLTHGPEKNQLFARNFKANPNLATGTFIPSLESQLQQGNNSSFHKNCSKNAEIDFDRYVPFDRCLQSFYDNYYTSIPSTHTIGVISKDLIKKQQ